MKIKYEMIDSNVLCVPTDEDANTSSGGIVLPDQMQSKPIKAKVIAVGPGDHLEDGSRCPMTVKVGMTVILLRKSGDGVYLDGQELIVIPEKYIVMILNELDDSYVPTHNTTEALKDTHANRLKLEEYGDGELVPVNSNGDIIGKKE